MNVRETYDAIASGFYHMRQKPVAPELYDVANKWKPALLLDAGCGIGTCALPFARAGFRCMGGDISGKMLAAAKKYSAKNKFDFALARFDCAALPFREGSFDYVIAVAAIHHLDTGEKRLVALQEINRVLKSGGAAFITVWNRNQPRFAHSKRDVMVPWKHEGVVHERYYHLFDEDELLALVKNAGLKALEHSASENICVLAEKGI